MCIGSCNKNQHRGMLARNVFSYSCQEDLYHDIRINPSFLVVTAWLFAFLSNGLHQPNTCVMISNGFISIFAFVSVNKYTFRLNQRDKLDLPPN